MRADKIRVAFEALLTADNPASRGRTFENLLSAKLSLEGFSTRMNPKAAKPRQTDLVASLASQDFLIEAKWRQKRVDVADVDSLRARLQRTPSDFIGCIFNMSDFTATALAAVENDRTREILLFNAGEINSIFTGRSTAEYLIRRKRDALRMDAKVYFLDLAISPETAGPVFPITSQQLIDGSQTVPCFSFPTNGHDSSFFLEIPDICARNTSGSIELRLDLLSVQELSELLGLIGRTIGLSESGSFSIHQRSHSWHGFGVANFLDASRNWQQRYEIAGLKFPHHSEVLAYNDLSKGVLMSVTSQQRIGDSSFLHGSFLELQLAGIPVNMSPILELCRMTKNEDAVVDTRTDKHLHYAQLHHLKIGLKPTFKITTGHMGKEWVSGIVAKNPFKSRRIMNTLTKDLDKFFLRHLSEPEFLICEMDDHYLVTDEVTRPFISHIYGVWAGHMPLFNVHCAWDDFVRRTPEEEGDWDAILREVPDVIGDDDDCR